MDFSSDVRKCIKVPRLKAKEHIDRNTWYLKVNLTIKVIVGIIARE